MSSVFSFSENYVISWEIIILQIYGNRWLILYNELTEDCRKAMKPLVSMA